MRSTIAVGIVALASLVGCGPGVVRADTPCPPAPPWSLWVAYKAAFIESDGRVVDHLAKHTTSEGQAYALFHALVARDEPTFRKVLAWTDKNLGRGDVAHALPAWRWADGKITDTNPASDADLWMAYALVHAATVFEDDKLATKGGGLLALIATHEVVDLPGLGPMMLPGPKGFDLGKGVWRLNPSYLPLQVLRWAARIDPGGPWQGVITSTLRMAEEATPGRVWPDWTVWNGQAFEPDPVSGALGSYDAIRAYLWPAMLANDEPSRGPLLARGTRMLEATRTLGLTPDRLATNKLDDLAQVVLSANSPIGFRGIARAYARALGDDRTAAHLATTIDSEHREDGLYGHPAFYYDQNLLLFATGFIDGRYRFRADGGLELARPTTGPLCTPP